MAPFASVESETQSSTCIRVLIPTHGRAALLGRTLASLAECSIPGGYAETVVVENGSRAGAEAVVAEVAAANPHLRLRYMQVERANKSHALNVALSSGVPSVAIGWAHKYPELLGEFGMERLVFDHDALTPDALIKAVLDVWDSRADYRAEINERLPEVKERSALVFESTVSLLHLRRREN